MMWTTKAGEEVDIRDMTDSHISNTIAMLERSAPLRLARAQASYDFIAPPTAEMASYCFEREYNSIMFADPIDFLIASVPAFRSLVKEADRRGLISNAESRLNPNTDERDWIL